MSDRTDLTHRPAEKQTVPSRADEVSSVRSLTIFLPFSYHFLARILPKCDVL